MGRNPTRESWVSEKQKLNWNQKELAKDNNELSKEVNSERKERKHRWEKERAWKREEEGILLFPCMLYDYKIKRWIDREKKKKTTCEKEKDAQWKRWRSFSSLRRGGRIWRGGD